VTDNPAVVVVNARSNGADSITCEIDAPGAKPVTDTSTGAYAVGTCSSTDL
jgi:hypothetical protein